MMETEMTKWVDPYEGWTDDLRGKKVIMTVSPDGEPGVSTGFVVGTVLHQEGDILHISLGTNCIDVHRQYVHRTLLDDEPVPDTMEGLPRLN